MKHAVKKMTSAESQNCFLIVILYHRKKVCAIFGKQLIDVYNINCFQNSKEIVLTVSSSVMGHVKLRVISGISSMLDML